jgi:hypothetical protein
MHLDEEQLQRLLHRQLPSRAARSARDHLAECGDCRERFVTAERDDNAVLALLREVDHEVPVVDPEALVARLRWTGAGWGRWAAGFLLLVGIAGAAYALPGSPVRQWVRSAVAWIAGSGPRPSSTRAEVSTLPVAGIAAVPGPRFVIAFQSPEPGGHARVSLTDGKHVTVRAPSGAAGFTSAANRLVIANTGRGATFEIEIPRSAPRVEIRVAGARIFLKDGSRVTSDWPATVEGGYLIPLSPHRP